MTRVFLFCFFGVVLLNADLVLAASNDKLAEEKTASEKAVVEEQNLQQMNAADLKPQKKDELENASTTTSIKRVEAQGFDVQMRRLSDAMALGLKRLPGDHRDQIFAVFTFDDVGDEAKARQLGLVVTDQVMNDLFKSHRLNLVERGALQKVIAEQGLSQMGLVDPKNAVSVGRIAGAQALVVGQITDKGKTFQISGRVVDAETGEIFVTELVAVNKADLIAFSADSVVLKSKGAAAIRSALMPGWGQFYNGQQVKAAFVGGTFATAVLATGLTAALAYSTHQAYSGFTPEAYETQTGQKINDSNQQDVVSGLREQANTQYSIAAVMGAAAGVIWLFGITDAYISGIDVDSLDDAMSDR